MVIIWLKIYDKNEKQAKMKKCVKHVKHKKQYTDYAFLLQNCKKRETEGIHIYLTLQNDCLNIGFVNDFHVGDKKMTRRGLKTAICHSQILRISL